MTAYTNTPWNDSNPPNSQAANTAATELRKLRLDLDERIESFFQDIDANPLVPKVGSIPNASLVTSTVSAGIKVQEHFTSGRVYDSAGTGSPINLTNVNYATITWDGIGITTGSWIQPLYIAKDINIASIVIRHKRDAGAVFTATLYRATDDTIENLVSSVSVTTGWASLTLTIVHTIAAAYTYYLKVDMSTNAGGTANARYQSMYVEIP